MTHICVDDLTIIGPINGLSPGRRQAIIWINPGILFIEPLGKTISEIPIGILQFSLPKMRLKVSSAKWRSYVSASMCPLWYFAKYRGTGFRFDLISSAIRLISGGILTEYEARFLKGQIMRLSHPNIARQQGNKLKYIINAHHKDVTNIIKFKCQPFDYFDNSNSWLAGQHYIQRRRIHCRIDTFAS